MAVTIPTTQTPGPGLATVNNGNPTFPNGATINNGSGPPTVVAPNQNGGSTQPTPAQSGLGNPTGGGNYGPTASNPYGWSTVNGQVVANTAPASSTDSTLYGRIPSDGTTTPPVSDGSGNAYAGTGESESDIQAAQLAERQSQIDGINSTYDKQISDMTTQQNNEGAVRGRNLEALAAFSGLGGSPTAISQDSKNNSATDNAISSNSAAINLARSNALSGVYSAIDSNTQAILKAQAANDTTAETKAISDAKDSATAQIQVLAQTVGASGVAQSWAQIKAADPELVANIEQQTGMSDAQLNLAYNAALPANLQTKWDLNSVPGYAVGTDSSGKVTTLNLGTAAPKGYTVVNDNGTLFAYDPKDPKGTITTLENVPKTPTAADSLQSATKDMAAQLQPQAGSDGFVSPQDYKTARNAWVGQGLSAKDFDAQFSYLANPDDPTGGLKAYGLSTTKSSTSSSSSGTGTNSSSTTPLNIPGLQ